MNKAPVAVYADGGVIGHNPSLIGGTWAYCWLDESNVFLAARRGVILAAEEDGYCCPPVDVTKTPVQHVTNNLTEFFALGRALHGLPDGWSGQVYSDSRITLGRFFQAWKCEGVPATWIGAMRHITDRLGKIEWTLLDGHPTKAQLASGRGKRGNPCSEYNVWCDKACSEVGREYMAWKAKREEDAAG